MVATARSRNKADNVTGALMYTDAGFVQVLEGPRDVLERTFERIEADPRHTDVTILSFIPIHRRSFPDWPMGFCGHSPADRAGGAPGPRVLTGSELLRFLEGMIQQEDAWIGLDQVSRGPENPAPDR